MGKLERVAVSPGLWLTLGARSLSSPTQHEGGSNLESRRQTARRSVRAAHSPPGTPSDSFSGSIRHWPFQAFSAPRVAKASNAPQIDMDTNKLLLGMDPLQPFTLPTLGKGPNAHFRVGGRVIRS